MAYTARSADGTQIVYDVVGTVGRPLVFIHGWACNRSYWRELLDVMRPEHAVTLDLAGHGESAASRSDWSMTAFGADVVAVLEAENLNDVVLIGHSMGGNAALEAARAAPDRVAGVIWLDTYGTLDVGPDTPSVEEIVAPIAADYAVATASFVRNMFTEDDDPAVAERIAADMAAADPTLSVQWIRASLTYGRTARTLVGDVACPIVAINTDYLGADLESLERYGVIVKRIASTGHFPMFTAPKRLAAVIGDTMRIVAAGA